MLAAACALACASSPRGSPPVEPRHTFAVGSAGARLLDLGLPDLRGLGTLEWATTILLIDDVGVWQAESLDDPFAPLLPLARAGELCDGEGVARCTKYLAQNGQLAVPVAFQPGLPMGHVRPLLLALAANHVDAVTLVRCGDTLCGIDAYPSSDSNGAVTTRMIHPEQAGTVTVHLDSDVRATPEEWAVEASIREQVMIIVPGDLPRL